MGELIRFCTQTIAQSWRGCVYYCYRLLPFQENKTTISSALIFNIFEMLLYICFVAEGKSGGRSGKVAEKEAKTNLIWGEWVGDQRVVMLAEPWGRSRACRVGTEHTDGKEAWQRRGQNCTETRQEVPAVRQTEGVPSFRGPLPALLAPCLPCRVRCLRAK